MATRLDRNGQRLEEQRRSPDLDALSFEERIGLLLDREAAERDTKRLTTRLKFAALRQSACLERWRGAMGAMAACSRCSGAFSSSSSTTGACRFSVPPSAATKLEILDDRHGRASTIVTS